MPPLPGLSTEQNRQINLRFGRGRGIRVQPGRDEEFDQLHTDCFAVWDRSRAYAAAVLTLLQARTWAVSDGSWLAGWISGFAGQQPSMVRRHELTDAQWRKVESLLPVNGRPGEQWADHRRVVNGVLFRARTGVPWPDLPERYGPWQTFMSGIAAGRPTAPGRSSWTSCRSRRTPVTRTARSPVRRPGGRSGP